MYRLPLIVFDSVRFEFVGLETITKLIVSCVTCFSSKDFAMICSATVLSYNCLNV